jgi:hypothetical protein
MFGVQNFLHETGTTLQFSSECKGVAIKASEGVKPSESLEKIPDEFGS